MAVERSMIAMLCQRFNNLEDAMLSKVDGKPYERRRVPIPVMSPRDKLMLDFMKRMSKQQQAAVRSHRAAKAVQTSSSSMPVPTYDSECDL